MINFRISLVLVVALVLLRALMAADLPLSADEAYYWLWSRHPAAGYFDHPPMIAWLIRAGTLLFGDTPFGVRFAGVVLSLPASWFVWRAASLILKDHDRAMRPVLQSDSMVWRAAGGTPDMPSIVERRAVLFMPHAGPAREGDAQSWLGQGIVGWVCFQILPGSWARRAVWLIGSRRQEVAFSPLLYLAPVWRWRSLRPIFGGSHSIARPFAFQFARLVGHFTLRFLGEFPAAQLVSPPR